MIGVRFYLLFGYIFSHQALSWASSSEPWLAYKDKYNKNYEHEDEDRQRKFTFELSRIIFEQWNREQSEITGYKVGLNHMSDWTEEEEQYLRGLRQLESPAISYSDNTAESQAYLDSFLDDNASLPAEVDWRTVPGRVTEVKDQALCKSDWAFSITGNLEGQAVKHGFKATDLSQQCLLDCSSKDVGCEGGSPITAINFIRLAKGIMDASTYPYIAKTNSKCHFNASDIAMRVLSYALLKAGDEEQLRKVVARYGPVAVGIDSSGPFKNYESGLYINSLCSATDLDHAALVVGYGSCSRYGDYWLVKNSWGRDWGEEGYIRMARGRNNMCGIASLAVISVPELAK